MGVLEALEPTQSVYLRMFEGQVFLQERFIATWQRLDAKVWHAVVEVFAGVGGLAPLELGEARQEGQPQLRWVPEVGDRGAGVADEKPRPRLERLDGAAGLEPGRATSKRNPRTVAQGRS